MSVGREPARAGDGLPQQRQPACASPPSFRRPNHRGATLTRSLSESATASPRAIFGGRDGRRKPLGAERRLTPLPTQLRRVQLHGSQMGPKAAPAAASWRLWGSLERRRRCAFATWAYTTSRGGSSCERWTKARAGCWGIAMQGHLCSALARWTLLSLQPTTNLSLGRAVLCWRRQEKRRGA